MAVSEFLSTPSARRATGRRPFRVTGSSISIHALREEGDFLSDTQMVLIANISIHALREEGDCPAGASASTTTYFYPRPPRGGRRLPVKPKRRGDVKFLSTPSARRATKPSSGS